MTASFDATPCDILEAGCGHRRAARAAWPRLTGRDVAGIRTKDDLAACVATRHDLPGDQAARDVALWAAERRFARWTF